MLQMRICLTLRCQTLHRPPQRHHLLHPPPPPPPHPPPHHVMGRRRRRRGTVSTGRIKRRRTRGRNLKRSRTRVSLGEASTSYSNPPGPTTLTTSTATSYHSGPSTSATIPSPATVTCLPNDYQGRHQISREELENVLSLKTTFTEAASILSISRPTFYKLLQDYNIPTSKFKNISDQQLDLEVSQIKTEHPNVGEVMLMGHLRSKNIVVQRHRLRDSVRRMDPIGVLARRRTAITRWKLVVHGAIDGYSRMLMFLHCSNNNRAETVRELFSAAVGQFGRPLHIRTDHGGENAQIWEDMHASRGEGSVLTGSSVHNQRIERFNRDLNKNCSQIYAPIFYELESLGILDIDNATDLFCLHYVFVPRINHTLEEFKAGYNNHSVSSEGNRTPVQLFTLDNDLTYLQNTELPTAGVVFCSSSNSQRFSPLNDRDLQELNDAINPLQNDNNSGKTLFQRTQQFIFDKLINV